MDMTERLLRHDAWTTRLLLHRSLDLSDEQLDREFDIGHRSLRRTFVHMDYLDKPARRKPLGGGLLHVATHGMHHRAQCLYLMRLLGFTNLPEGDALSWEAEHRGSLD